MSRCDNANPILPLLAQRAVGSDVAQRGPEMCSASPTRLNEEQNRSGCGNYPAQSRGMWGDRLHTHRAGREHRLCQCKAGERGRCSFTHTHLCQTLSSLKRLNLGQTRHFNTVQFCQQLVGQVCCSLHCKPKKGINFSSSPFNPHVQTPSLSPD